MPASLGRFGSRAALGAGIAALLYAIPQVLVVTVWAPPVWLETLVLMGPSLFIALFFVPAMAAVYVSAPADRRVQGLTALAFGIMYAALVGAVYMTQLSLVVPEQYAGREPDPAIFLVTEGSLMTMMDAIGYGFMSVAAFFAAGTIVVRDALSRWTHHALVAHGLIAPFIVLAASVPLALLGGMLWLVTGPASLLLLAAWFRRAAAVRAPTTGRSRVAPAV